MPSLRLNVFRHTDLHGGENINKFLKIGIIFALIAIMLIGANFREGQASDQTNQTNTLQPPSEKVIPLNQTNPTEADQTVLNDFLLRLSEHESRGNATKLSEIRSQMIQQEKINKAISHSNPPHSSVNSVQPMDSYSQGYLSTNPDEHKSPDQYTPPDSQPLTPGTLIGKVENPSYACGSYSNGYGAHYLIQGWYYLNGAYTWGEALSWGDASQAYNGLAEFHIIARTDMSGQIGTII